MKKIPIKKEIIIIIFGILLNFLASHYNLDKYDKIIKNYEVYPITKFMAQIYQTLGSLQKILEKISQTNNFFDSLPHYERFYLPSIFVGFYYYLIDKEIYKTIDTGEKVVKKDNYKFGITFNSNFVVLFFILSL